MLLYHEKKHGQIINLIDCTPVWLLVETGLIGLLAFAAFYVQSFRALYMQWKQDEGFIRAFRLGIIAAMETRDPQKAVAALSAHIDNARNRALGLR